MKARGASTSTQVQREGVSRGGKLEPMTQIVILNEITAAGKGILVLSKARILCSRGGQKCHHRRKEAAQLEVSSPLLLVLLATSSTLYCLDGEEVKMTLKALHPAAGLGHMSETDQILR